MKQVKQKPHQASLSTCATYVTSVQIKKKSTRFGWNCGSWIRRSKTAQAPFFCHSSCAHAKTAHGAPICACARPHACVCARARVTLSIAAEPALGDMLASTQIDHTHSTHGHSALQPRSHTCDDSGPMCTRSTQSAVVQQAVGRLLVNLVR